MSKHPISRWWPYWLTGAFLAFIVPELVAVVRGKGGSLSAWVRKHIHAKTTRGKVIAWVIGGCIIALGTWLGGHFAGMPGWSP